MEKEKRNRISEEKEDLKRWWKIVRAVYYSKVTKEGEGDATATLSIDYVG